MIRSPLLRILRCNPTATLVRCKASAAAPVPAKAPEKIEVFIDDQSVMVDPGTTVLQVHKRSLFTIFSQS
jgi:NADH dehydrogenase (ubiquinone) Fe-S protein 1